MIKFKFFYIFVFFFIFIFNIYSKHLNLVHSDVFTVSGSDHRGVIAQIKMKANADK